VNIRLRALVALSTLPVAACAADAGNAPTPEEVGTVSQDINGPNVQDPVSWQIQRAAFVETPLADGHLAVCSGTRISPWFVLTAAHCQPTLGTTVKFFISASKPDGTTAGVVNVNVAPGLDKNNLDYDPVLHPGVLTDSNGDFADMALLQLDREVPGAATATLSWTYPGPNANGVQVGSGAASGDEENLGKLLQTSNVTDSGDDSGGGFHTQHDFVDEGDSGGPFYFGGRVLGDLFGNDLDGNLNHDFYTSVPHRLAWMLGVIGYRWSGGQTVFGKALTGTVDETFRAATEAVCQYACDQKALQCRGYDYTPSALRCSTFTAVTGVSASSGVQYAIHFGKPSSRTGDPIAYDRAPYPGYDSVVKHAVGGDVHELYFAQGMPQWQVGDLSADAHVPTSTPGNPVMTGRASVYVRSDGINAVLYRTTDGEIRELSLSGGTWTTRDLSGYAAPGFTASGDPAAYIRSDGTSVVVYRSVNFAAGTSELIELSAPLSGPTSQTWNVTHLTNITGAAAPAGDASAHVRSDGLSSVVYRSAAGHVLELFSSDGLTWTGGDPWQNAWQNVSGTHVLAAGNPFGFTDGNGSNAIAYRGTDNHVYELYLAGNVWQVADLTTITGNGTNPTTFAAGDPFAYVRAEGTTAIVFRTQGNEVFEYSLGSNWSSADLTAWGHEGDSSISWSGIVAGDPTAYVRADGVSAVVFRDAANHTRELSMAFALAGGGTGWEGWDLTKNTGETP
jgi:hypothetical protein